MMRRVPRSTLAGAMIAFAIAIVAPQATAQTTVNYKIKCTGLWEVTLTWTENGTPIGTDGPRTCMSRTPEIIDIEMPPNSNGVQITGTLMLEREGILTGECVSRKSFPVGKLGKMKGHCKVQASPEGAMAKLNVFLK